MYSSVVFVIDFFMVYKVYNMVVFVIGFFMKKMAGNNNSSYCNAKRSQSSPQRQIRKKICVNDPAFQEICRELLSTSDESDNEENIEQLLVSETELTQQHETDEEEDLDDYCNLEEDVESDSSDVPLSESRSNFYYGKNRYKWSKSPPTSRVRTAQHNIITSRIASSNLTADDNKDPLSIWSKLFDDEMLQQILKWTNVKIGSSRTKFARLDRAELKDLDIIELQAFLGLLFYSAVLKSNHENTSYLFALDGTGCEIFRCCMSETRFLIVLFCLRFDNPSDRAERNKTDVLAAISDLFNKFVSNSQKLYECSECVTVDEMLVKFRGRSRMTSYMPKKPGKYGLVIRALCDSKNFYFYNGYVYTGKNSDGGGLTPLEQKFLVPTQCVLRLTKPIQGSNRNVTADNWFSSIQLVDELSKRNLTYVGTVKKNKRELPSEFQPQKNREIQSTLFGFTKDKTLCSYVPKKNRAAVLLSSMHHCVEVDENTKKPEIIMYYNSTKGGVDEADKKCSIYSSSRRTRRWPMVLFYRILDLSGMNAYILHNMHQVNDIERGDFLKKLARSLVVPHMQRRVNTNLPRELKLTMTRVLGKDMVLEEVREQETSKGNRRTCRICPAKKHRMTTYVCVGCSKPVCLQCSRPLCNDCQ